MVTQTQVECSISRVALKQKAAEVVASLPLSYKSDTRELVDLVSSLFPFWHSELSGSILVQSLLELEERLIAEERYSTACISMFCAQLISFCQDFDSH